MRPYSHRFAARSRTRFRSDAAIRPLSSGPASPAPSIDPKVFSVRWSGTLMTPAPGDYEFTANLAHCYPCNNAENFTIRGVQPIITAAMQTAKTCCEHFIAILFVELVLHLLCFAAIVEKREVSRPIKLACIGDRYAGKRRGFAGCRKGLSQSS